MLQCARRSLVILAAVVVMDSHFGYAPPQDALTDQYNQAAARPGANRYQLATPQVFLALVGQQDQHNGQNRQPAYGCRRTKRPQQDVIEVVAQDGKQEDADGKDPARPLGRQQRIDDPVDATLHPKPPSPPARAAPGRAPLAG